MAITAAMRQDIMELAVLMNNKAPGTALLGELVVAANSGQTLEQIAATLAARAEFKATYPLFQTAKEFGEEWIGNILPEADAALQAEAVAIVEAHINGGGSIPDLVVSIQQFMSDSANATGALKPHIDNFTNKVAVATYHTITSEAADEWAIPATVTSSADSVVTGKSTVDTALTAATTASTPTYAISGAATANEGDSVNYTISTTNVASGGQLTYTIGGVQAADVTGGSLTGQATIGVDGKAVVAVGIAADATTEGSETLTITAGGTSASTTIADTSLTPPPVGQVYSLTTAPNTFTGNSGDDTFNAFVANSWSTGDSIDGVSGNDSFNITSATAVTAPVGASVANIDTSTITTTGNVTLNTTGWTGLTTLNSTGAGKSALTASATTDVTSTTTLLVNAAGNEQQISGGKDVTSTTTVANTLGTTAASQIVIGGATTAAPAGAVTVTHTETATDDTGNTTSTGSALTITGGTSITSTYNMAEVGTSDNANDAITAGVTTITGNASTTTVSATQTAAAARSANGAAIVNGAVTVNDVNRASATKAGTITDVTVSSGAAVAVNSGALETLNASGTMTTLNAGTLGALTTAAINDLDLNLSALRTTGAVTIDSDVKTLNVKVSKVLNALGTETASNVADLDVSTSGGKTVNISGDGKLTIGALGNANTTASFISTNTGGVTITPSLGTGVTFTGGDGADTITIGATTKTITTGAGNDAVTTGAAFGTGGSLDGGDGVDTLSLTAANVVTASSDGTYETKVSGFERVAVAQISGNIAVNTANLDDINYITVAGSAGNTQVATLNNLAANPTAVVSAAMGGAAAGVTLSLADATGTSDAVNLKISTNADSQGGVFTANSVETVNLESDDTATTSAGAANPNTQVATLAGNAIKTLNITGDAGLTLTNTSTTITSFNASGQTGASDGDGTAWATIGALAGNATFTGSPKNDNLGGTGNSGVSTKAQTMDGGAGQDTLGGGAGADTLTDTSFTAVTLAGNSFLGRGGNDTITGGDGHDTVDAGGANDSIVGGGGNDTLTAGAGNDIVLAGDGNDTLVPGAGNDSLSGGAGNDTFQLGTDLTTSDTVDGGAGTDTMDIDARAAMVAGTVTGVETATIRFDTDTDTFNAAGISGLSTLSLNSTNNGTRVDVTNLATGVTVSNVDAEVDNLVIDTVAGADITFNQGMGTMATGITVTDAATVTVTNTAASASDIVALVLDTVDTTRLDVDAGTAGNLDTGNITGTNKLATVDLSTSTSGRTLTLGTLGDADALTSLTLNADGGDLTTVAIGSGGNAEGLATITVNASNNATATLGVINMDDSTNGTAADATAADLAATVTGTASFGSTADLGSPTNTFGTINLNTSGAGTVDSTLMRADDITGTLGAGGTHTAITATDDVTLTTTNANLLTISTLTTGATVASSASVTHTGSGQLTISALGATAGTLTVDATAGGKVNIVGSALTGKATLTGGTGADTLTSGSGADSLTGGDGADVLTPGTGNDTVSGGAGNDTFTMGSGWSTGDSITDSAGTDSLSATVAGSITPAALSGIESLTLTLNGGAVNATNISDVATVNIADSIANGTAVISNLPSTVTKVNQTTDLGIVSIGFKSGSTNDLTIDHDGATQAATNASTTILNQGGALTIDGDATHAVDHGSTVAASATSITVSAEAAALDVGNLTATAATTLTVNDAAGAGANTVGTIAAAKLSTLTINNAGAATTTTGAATLANALTSIDLDNSSTGNLVVGAITANAGTAATSLAVDIDLTGTSTTGANTIAALDIAADGVITDYNWNSGAINQANTVAAITAKSINAFTVKTGAGGNANALTFATMANVGSFGDVTIDSDDPVTFTTGATAATSIGNVVLKGKDTSSEVNMGTWGTTNATVGNITWSGSFSANSDLTVGAALSVGAVSTAAVAAGTITVVLNDSTTIGTTMTGGAGVDKFTGTGGADTITGAGGADSLTGGSGADTITGGAAADTIVGGAGADTIALGTAGDVDVVVLVGTAAGGAAGIDVISGFTAGAGGDVLDMATNVAQMAANDPTTAFDANTTIDDLTGIIKHGTTVTQGASATVAQAMTGVTVGTFDGGGGTSDAVYLAYDDGQDTYIALVTSDGNDDGFTGDSIQVLAKLVGVADATALTAANFADFS